MALPTKPRIENSSVRIRWQTVAELDNLGFNLYRASEIDGVQEQLNSELIPAQAPGSGQGASYEWIDGNVEVGGTYYYWLEDVDVNGTTTRHGSVSTTVNQTTAVTIGSFSTTRSLMWAFWPIALSLMLALLLLHRWYPKSRTG